MKKNCKGPKYLPRTKLQNKIQIKGIKEIFYPGQNKFNRYKKNSSKEIQIPENINRDIDILISKF